MVVIDSPIADRSAAVGFDLIARRSFSNRIVASLGDLGKRGEPFIRPWKPFDGMTNPPHNILGVA